MNTENSTIYLQSISTCDNIMDTNITEARFLNMTTINTQTGTGATTWNLTLYGDDLWTPGIMRWNYTETGATITGTVYGDDIYNGTRGTQTFTGTWTFNETLTETGYEEYFTRPSLPSITKLSSDAGDHLYNYTNFTCNTDITIGDYMRSDVDLNISFYKDGILQESELFTSVSSGQYNSTIDINESETTIGELWNCTIYATNNTFTRSTTEQKSINYTYPYNLSIYVGNFNAVAGSLVDEYL